MKIWFQNRRSKIKKQNKQPDADSSSSSISSCIVGGGHSDTIDRASPPSVHASARRYREDDDNARSMFPPDSSVVYRRRAPQSAAAIPAHPHSHHYHARAASEPEATNARLAQPDSKTHLSSYDVDVQPSRRHHDLLPAQQLVLPSLQLLSGFHHPAAAAASESSSAWSNNIAVPVPPLIRDAGELGSFHYDTDAADSSSYVPWYSHHLIDSYSPR